MISLTSEQAYAAMFFFLEDYFSRSRSDEIGGLLGSLSLLDDGCPADPAMRGDWQKAVEKAIERGTAPRLELKKE